MRRRLSLAALIAGLVLLASSCTVGPRYTKPATPAATQFSEAPPANWSTATPADTQLRGDWWELFHDSTLTNLEQQVATANQTVKVAEANFRRAEAAIAINRSNLYPTLGSGPDISTSRTSANSPTGLPGHTFANFALPISVSFDADLWGRIRRSIAAARELYQASAADVENVKLELQTELAVDYFEVRSLDAQRRILDRNVQAYTKALQLTRNRYEGGVASKVEVTQAQAQLDQTQAQEIDLESARTAFEHAIAILTGQLPEGFHLPSNPLNDEPPPIPVGVPSQLLQRRPDIAFAERNVAASNEQIGIARAAFFPDLVISATGGLQAGSLVNWFTWPSRYWSAGPQILQTFFDAGRRRAELEAAQALYEGNVANYRQVTLNAFGEVEDNLAALRVLESEQVKQHEAALAAENTVQLALNRYKGGLSTYLEVITAQTIALTNERAEADLLRRRMEASVRLIRALGGGWDASQLPR